ncbi:hypothetical protein FE633_11470 [Streptomyces montanus]|uniref:Aminotransferase class I/II-fold pyridoxal phosphate-dependent enzyme n=1 Tax=Streptomyces montanus TaxID=2580423 RepID=A0A5R9FQE5_9ACTN|nr:hypothetical protein [Streptomyces montanus]TLS46147.1 hypothetical protein FE633_11470 [Streptomyces montanus]
MKRGRTHGAQHTSAPRRPTVDPSAVQGGDLTHLPDGLITLNLSLCTNRLGPPPAAVEALQNFLASGADRLMPPPYQAERRYVQAVAHWLGVDERHMIAGRGVTEFLMILARLLSLSRVAVVTPEYTMTMRHFHYAHFEHPDDPTLTEVARELGISSESLWGWVKKTNGTGQTGAGTSVAAGSGLDAAEREELKRLRKLAADQAKTIEILKEATAFFAQESDR